MAENENSFRVPVVFVDLASGTGKIIGEAEIDVDDSTDEDHIVRGTD